MAALRIEEREARLLGLDAAIKFDPETFISPPNAEQQVATLREHLDEHELRQLVYLLRKGKGLDVNERPAIDVTPRTSPPSPPAPAPTATPAPQSGFVHQPEIEDADPEPSKAYRDVDA